LFIAHTAKNSIIRGHFLQPRFKSFIAKSSFWKASFYFVV